MQEILLHYIWKYQLFNKTNLQTHSGQKIEILWSGTPNRNTGPDFLSAKIKIDNQLLYGHVELHLKQSDWCTHQHDKNSAYDNVILHVVWHPTTPTKQLPTLFLAQHVNPTMLTCYEELMKSEEKIPCTRYLPTIDPTQWTYMVKKALKRCLQQKSLFVNKMLKQNNNDSDTTSYQLLAKAFGFNLNKKAFLTLSQKAPFSVVQQNSHDLDLLEALLFGQAGFLTHTTLNKPYINKLREKHASLAKKYALPSPMPAMIWQFFRSRPANAPTLRIAQMARFLHKQQAFFSFLVNTPYQKLTQKLRRNPSRYWKNHYSFHKKAKSPIPPMGIQSINIIIINTIIPLLTAYGSIRQDSFYTEQALNLLKQLPPEKNIITTQWIAKGMPIKNAFDSQGSLALFNDFCTPRKCLSCSIGRHILKKTATPPRS